MNYRNPTCDKERSDGRLVQHGHDPASVHGHALDTDNTMRFVLFLNCTWIKVKRHTHIGDSSNEFQQTALERISEEDDELDDYKQKASPTIDNTTEAAVVSHQPCAVNNGF
ncbi:hypothetical protein J6590_082891 [Homalodisca vitripennis]|nr:hypothetical protein J6590_082891 [Homalodisca vitripennis]